MELAISIDKKLLCYQVGDMKGNGLDELIGQLGSLKFDKVSLSGESTSYTFLRQIALLVNLLIKIKKVEVKLATACFKRRGDLIIPLYKEIC